MARESLLALYTHQLEDLYSAEQQITEALPKLAKAASHEELRRAFDEHLRVTKKQIERLDRIFGELGSKPGGKKCKGMEGLIKEGDETLKEHKDSDVLDAALIAAAQRVEHYEIAGYGCARTYADMLGLSQQADLLQQTLDEEGETDHRLTDLAESVINIDALKA